MQNIEGIQIIDHSSYKTKEKGDMPFLEPISRINIFVGANSSGKSRLMRQLAAQAKYLVKSRDDLRSVTDKIESFLGLIKKDFQDLRIQQFGKIRLDQFDIVSPQSANNQLSLSEDLYSDLRQFVKSLAGLDTNDSVSPSGLSLNQKIRVSSTVSNSVGAMEEELAKIPVYSRDSTPLRIYIPTLRGLRPLDPTHTDYYFNCTKKAYFADVITSGDQNHQDPKDQLQIFTGLQFYDRLKELLLGDNQERQSINSYQDFISKTLFEGESIALIPSPKEEVVVVKIGRERERPIHHLGDGIQSAIILSFLPFVTRGPAFFFIEEPEMYLHPGLQRKILEFFATKRDQIFFLTTHSNHFLDLTIDIKDVSIFTFSKELEEDQSDERVPTFSVEVVDSGCSSSLELLGVRNSSVFLVNATIWVEGITDRLYLRRMLELYLQHLKTVENQEIYLEEDVHYSFVEYGGSNIVHWSFLDRETPQINVDRLCARSMVIIDGDGASKLERKKALKKKLGDRFVQLSAREIENVLPFDVINDVVLEFEKTPERVLKTFKYADYKDEYLGTFIENELLEKKIKRKAKYSLKSGTLNSKLDFCKLALPLIKYDNLDGSIKNILKKIYEFICTMNR